MKTSGSGDDLNPDEIYRVKVCWIESSRSGQNHWEATARCIYIAIDVEQKLNERTTSFKREQAKAIGICSEGRRKDPCQRCVIDPGQLSVITEEGIPGEWKHAVISVYILIGNQ